MYEWMNHIISEKMRPTMPLMNGKKRLLILQQPTSQSHRMRITPVAHTKPAAKEPSPLFRIWSGRRSMAGTSAMQISRLSLCIPYLSLLRLQDPQVVLPQSLWKLLATSATSRLPATSVDSGSTFHHQVDLFTPALLSLLLFLLLSPSTSTMLDESPLPLQHSEHTSHKQSLARSFSSSRLNVCQVRACVAGCRYFVKHLRS